MQDICSLAKLENSYKEILQTTSNDELISLIDILLRHNNSTIDFSSEVQSDNDLFFEI